MVAVLNSKRLHGRSWLGRSRLNGCFRQKTVIVFRAWFSIELGQASEGLMKRALDVPQPRSRAKHIPEVSVPRLRPMALQLLGSFQKIPQIGLERNENKRGGR